MPKYRKKITRPMDYDEFKTAIIDLPIARQAFLSILFFAGCRISEALALTSDDIHCTKDMIYIQFFRLKGSKQTDPQEIPRADALEWLCEQEGKLFTFCRKTGYNIVNGVFSQLYPHYFRMNRVTKVLDKFGAVTVQNTFGLSLNSIQSYVGKVDIKRVGKALHEEVLARR